LWASRDASLANDSAGQADASARLAETRASTALSYAVDSEAWAVGERRRIPVVDDADETFRNNSKYYAELAGQLAANAEAAAESAGNAAAAVQAIQGKTAQIDANTAAIEELMYKPIEINSFSIATPASLPLEKGSTVTEVSLNYGLSKFPVVLKLNNDDVTPLAVSGTISLTGQNIQASKKFTLYAEDSGVHGGEHGTASNDV